MGDRYADVRREEVARGSDYDKNVSMCLVIASGLKIAWRVVHFGAAVRTT